MQIEFVVEPDETGKGRVIVDGWFYGLPLGAVNEYKRLRDAEAVERLVRALFQLGENMSESEAFEHWIDTFDGGLVVTNRLIWAAAWKAATEATREACADEIERKSGETYAVLLCEHKEAADWLRSNA